MMRNTSFLLLMLLWTLPGGLRADTIFVSASAAGADRGTSWADAHPDLQNALLRANAGDEIWVAIGTYVPRNTNEPNAPLDGTFVVPTGVALYGGFDGTEQTRAERAGRFSETVLSGDRNNDDEPLFAMRSDNVYRVMRVILGDAGNIIDGFVIRSGYQRPPRRSAAGLLVSEGEITLRNTTFYDNRCEGGPAVSAAALLDCTRATVEDCAFRENRGRELSYGSLNRKGVGGLTVRGADVEIRRCAFEDNVARGGAAGGLLVLNVVSAGRQVLIEDCHFARNRALCAGGAHVAATGIDLDLDVVRTSFVENEGEFLGGMFVDNFFDNSSPGPIASRVRVADCRFESNESTDATLGGGGLAIFNPRNLAELSLAATVERCEFIANRATRAQDQIAAGGGAFVLASWARLVSSDFIDNEMRANASAGGAYIEAPRVELANLRVIGNRTKRRIAERLEGRAGGLHVVAKGLLEDTNLVMHNVVCCANQSADSGGALLDVGTAELSQLTLADNYAADSRSGLRLAHSGPATLSNSVLWGNLADEPGIPDEQLFTGVADMTVSACNIQNFEDVYAGGNNLDTPPRFVDPVGLDGLPGTGDENYGIQFDSPCIDAGDNALIPVDITDLDSDGDTTETLPSDLDGAPRRLDQQLQADSGVGTSPIVDIGAHEFANTCPADIDGDLRIDMSDLAILLSSFGSATGDASFEPPADIRPDGRIDLNDLAALLSLFGASCK